MGTFSKTALYNAVGVVVYIFLVTTIIANAPRFFGEKPGYLGQIAFLCLFTLSAAVVAGLIIGKPIMLYLENQKSAALSLFFQTVAWLAGFTVVLLIVLASLK